VCVVGNAQRRGKHLYTKRSCVCVCVVPPESAALGRCAPSIDATTKGRFRRMTLYYTTPNFSSLELSLYPSPLWTHEAASSEMSPKKVRFMCRAMVDNSAQLCHIYIKLHSKEGSKVFVGRRKTGALGKRPTTIEGRPTRNGLHMGRRTDQGDE